AAGKGPKVETADAPPAAEDATVTPDVIKSQMALGSGGARGGEDGD
ncbi:MAG: hypothetical protein GWN87_03855, partial [Desulfuromonadales bacterium]|nr:hypothetical protein [Desulfuromonadales bacterium]